MTTNLPTPALDALNAVESDLSGAKAMFINETAATLSGEMTAKEAIAEAKRLVPWGTPQTTKAAAVRVIAIRRWEETEDSKTLRSLRRAADNEHNILAAIEKAPIATEVAQQNVTEWVAQQHAAYNTEYILDAVIDLQSAAIAASLWADVVFAITENGQSPRDALVAVREHNLRSLISAVRGGSRSSSTTRNLTRETNVSVTAKWLDDTERFLG